MSFFKHIIPVKNLFLFLTIARSSHLVKDFESIKLIPDTNPYKFTKAGSCSTQ
jgi:hypothetical protein